METFHMRNKTKTKQTSLEDLFAGFSDNYRYQETKKIKLRNEFFKKIGNAHLVNLEGSALSLCDRCNCSMFVTKE